MTAYEIDRKSGAASRIVANSILFGYRAAFTFSHGIDRHSDERSEEEPACFSIKLFSQAISKLYNLALH